MTRKLTLSAVEQKNKVSQLTEETKNLPMFETAEKFAQAGLELSESMFDDKIKSPSAMDRLYIATHGTDAHRDQLLKDEDAMVRFGVAQRGHLTQLSQLANDPSPMVRDQVARNANEEIAQKMMNDPHPMVRSSAYNRMQEIRRTIDDPALISSENGHAVTEHFEPDADVQVVSDGRFAKVKCFFESKDGDFWYGVTLPEGGSEVLHASQVRGLKEDRENEFSANHALAGDKTAMKSTKPVKLKRSDGSIHSEHDNESSAVNAYKNEPNNKGMKIVREAYEFVLTESLAHKIMAGAMAISALGAVGGAASMAHNFNHDAAFVHRLEQKSPSEAAAYKKHLGDAAQAKSKGQDTTEHDTAMKAIADKHKELQESVLQEAVGDESLSALFESLVHKILAGAMIASAAGAMGGAASMVHDYGKEASFVHRLEQKDPDAATRYKEHLAASVQAKAKGQDTSEHDAAMAAIKTHHNDTAVAVKESAASLEEGIVHKILGAALAASAIGSIGMAGHMAHDYGREASFVKRLEAKSPADAAAYKKHMGDAVQARARGEDTSSHEAAMKRIASSHSDIQTAVNEDLEFPSIGLSIGSDAQLDPYDRQKAYHNECPFCDAETATAETATADEHRVAMIYHTEQAKNKELPMEERHFHSRKFMKHQRNV
jgi:hypothetical protein